MLLGTGKPKADIQGDRIVISIPSGNETAEIALTLHQALALRAAIRNVTDVALLQDFAAPSADIIHLPKRRKRKGG